MLHNFLLNTSFHNNLLEIDHETAQLVRCKGCPHCGGILHHANYPRIGFGIPRSVALFYEVRFSFCCALCRRRTTPPSIRFFGQRRFVSAVFVLLCALRLSPSEPRSEKLARRFGLNLSLSTWKRWRAWWRLQFLQTQFWIEAKSYFSRTIIVVPLPKALLRHFPTQHSLQKRLTLLLKFLLPLNSQAS
jgi:hypothetical protein